MSGLIMRAVAARLVRVLGWCALSLVFSTAALHAQELPTHVGKVNDFAELLTPAQRESLEAQLTELERETSAEVALVTMSSVGNEPIESYTTTLFNTWGVGKKGRDNGVMVLVAVADRAMRIEVGYGLEGVLPDGLAGAVMRETFLPRFRSDDYRTGVLEGMARVVEIVRRNETLSAEQRAALDRSTANAGKSWGFAVFLAIFVGIGAFSFGTAVGAKVVTQLLFGLVFTGGALYASTFVAPQAAVWLLALFALGVAAGGISLARRPAWRRTFRGTSAGSGGSGWMVTSGTTGSSSSGSSGSSSFGGGRSGGGGATGRW